VQTHLKIGVIVLCVLASACGNEETDPTLRPAAEAPSENVVPVAMAEYGYSMSDEVAGGFVTFEFTNNGDLPHEAAFGSVNEGVDVDGMVEAIQNGGQPRDVKDLAGLPVLDAGATMSMTRQLEPGSYVFFCYLPVPKSGEPHVTEGMVQAFEVSGSSGAAAPEADLTIAATDDGFEVPEIAAGTQSIELVNEVSESHEFMFYSLESGKKVQDIDKWFGSGFETDKPALFPGGLQSIDPGTSVVLEMTFESGRTYTIEDFTHELEAKFEPV
jgi:hypothetical protein